MSQLELFEPAAPVTVYCVFRCTESGRMVISPDADHAHTLMESHYQAYHRGDIDDRLLEGVPRVEA